MIVAKVVGNLWATRKHPSINGKKLLLVQPIDEIKGTPAGSILLAIDHNMDAGLGDTVLVIDEGSSCRQILGTKTGPTRTIIAGIIDQVYNKGKKAVSEILGLIESNNVGMVVIGYPYELDAKSGTQAKKVEAFTKKLEKALFKIPSMDKVRTCFWDERLTTRQAQHIVAGSGLKNKERSSALDRISAAIILESYMESQRK